MLEPSIPALLRERASLQPSETAYTFVDYEQDWAGVAESLTWSHLYQRVRNVARNLRLCASPGDRAVISAPQGLDYIVAFLGALEAGIIAVPLSVPLGGVADERVDSVLRDASPTTVLTTSSAVDDVTRHVTPRPGQPAPSIIEIDLLDLDAPAPFDTGQHDYQSTAYLQYTSGSTRSPAGVMVSYSNLQVNYKLTMASLFSGNGGIEPPDHTIVSWTPFYHDLGLIMGVCTPVLSGCSAVLTSPVAFLVRPARWMQMLASHPSASTGAPNFAFELATRKTSDEDMAGYDLGKVSTIISGAERVLPETIKRFSERFKRFNLREAAIRPTYGLAEATVYVATTTEDQPPRVVDFEPDKLSAGQAQRCARGTGTALISYSALQAPTVRIVDPDTHIECGQGSTGEIWVHGGNVSMGYWQKPEETERTFGAVLVEPSAGTPEGPWLRTGDLGFLSDGELFIFGRIKDLLIIYGRNHSPDDIEATIQEINRGRCVAIAVPDDDGIEKLVAIIELKKRDESEETAAHRMGVVRHEVTSAISKSHGLSVADLVLVPPHSIPLTTSGKVRRRACLELYLRDEFTRLDGLIRSPAPRVVDETGAGAGADSGLTQRLRTLRRQQRTLRQQQHDLLLGMVRSEAATVLGRPSPDDIDPDGAFQDLGFESVKAIELLDRLKTVTELELPPTLAFDYPTPDALAAHLSQLLSGSVAPAAPVEAQVAVDEPVAVVGMACRFPGGVDSAMALWDLVASGTDAVGEFPVDRGWNLAELFDPDPDAVGKTYTRSGGFLTEAADFDAEFFGISAREAQSMDPQQRLLLEVCWEALETARIDPASLAGSEAGVFVGAWSQQYGAGGSDGAEGYAMTGVSTSVASGRIAYVLGLQGPAITLDTACSSSLVATHLACQSLRHGESTLALAGGVTVMTTPAVFTEFARQRGLAADGRCKAFSGDADGTGWGEGAAVLVLERLSDATRNHHPVLAVIAGSAINQDGASNGLAAPNGPAQQRVITQAVANAGLGLDEVDVVEAHGTGTALGDPIEAGALIATYGAARDEDRPLWLGSIKSNIGHTQAAAGVAGIIKMIAALNHASLPPTLNVDHPSPHIDWSAGTVRLLTEPVPWPDTDHPRTAAVSSFGISGTNAHLILQQPSDPPAGSADPRRHARQTRHSDEFGLPLWPISARTPTALCAQADRLHQHLMDYPDLDLTDLACSLATTRTHHPYRAAITVPVDSADPRKDLLDTLGALRTGVPHPQLTQHHYLPHLRSKTVFVLPGQGAQYPGMGRELYEHNHVFADSVDNICEALDAHLEVSLREIMFAEPGSAVGELIHQTSYAQPALFAMGAAMHALFIQSGITPDYLLGHSIGELTAAYLAGVFSLADAAVLVTARGRLMQACPPGAMLAIQANEPAVEALLTDHPRIAIAAVNGPTSVVVSGDPEALEPIREHCATHGIRATFLSVSHAFHSSLMDPALLEFEAIAESLTFASPTVPILSNLTGQIATSEQLASSRYWTRHLREPVRFCDSVVERLAAGECTFVELSPHPVLAPAITDTLAQIAGRTQSAVITTLHRNRPDQDALATALAKLHNHGHSPSWAALYPHARTVALPTYPFEHRQYWLAPAPTGDARGLALGPAKRARTRWTRFVSGLVNRRPQADNASPRTMAAGLASQPPQQRLDTLTAMVTATTAAVLAHPEPATLDPDRPFTDIGIDSLTALELRTTLNQHTGLTLPATFAFDYPTPATLAAHLADLLADSAGPAVPAAQVGTPSDEPVDNRLTHVDQAVFRTMRAVHDALIQVTWIYDRAVDLDGLRRFHRNLGRGLLGRRIERSPLPFARDHWVLSPAAEDIDIAATPRPRADVNAWTDERARLPVDPEWGPGWHLGVLPLEDGGTAVSLVVSHTVVDGVGLVQAIVDAAEGRTHDLGYPPAGSRTRGRALREDLRQTVKDLPDVAQAVRATARKAWPDRKEFTSSIKAAPPAPRTASNDQAVEVPALTAYIDLAEWDSRAKSLGASSNSLAAGVACRLAVRVGRVHDDGTVPLRFPISQRTKEDTRSNALTVVDVTVDPTHAATDLGEMHVKITQAILAEMENADDEFLSTFPLAVMIPRWMNRRIAGMAAGGADLPVTVSNIGDLPPAGNRPDGTDADYVYMRNPEPDIKKSTLEHIGGQLFVGSGRGHEKIFFRISAYSLDRENTKDDLREVVSRTFAEFDLIAEIDC